MLQHSLPCSVKDLEQFEVLEGDQTVKFWIQEANIGRPSSGVGRNLYPSECREGRVTYQADLQLNIQVQVGENPPWTISRIAGQVPIMVKSDRCYLKGMNPKELIQHHEEAEVNFLQSF